MTDPANNNAPTQDDLNAPPGGGDNVPPITQPNAPDPKDPKNQGTGGDELNITPQNQPDPEPKDGGGSVDVGDFGDHGLNIAADFFVNTVGLDINGRELAEAAKGNFHLLEAKLEVLGDKAKGSGPMLQLAKESLSRVQAAAKTKSEATLKTVHEAVGGKDNWAAIQNFARTTFTQEQLDEANAGLSQGGFVAQAVARQLHALAAANPNVSTQGQPASNPDAPAASIAGHAPLTLPEYRKEYRKLVEKLGISGAAKSDELKALNARVQR